MQSSIRFVGGPWHNQIRDVELCPEIMLRRPSESPLTTTLSYAGCFTKVQEDRYFLANYVTCLGTHYYQYIHQSLLRDGVADVTTYRERLPRWTISTRQLDLRLRRAAGCLVKKRR